MPAKRRMPAAACALVLLLSSTSAAAGETIRAGNTRITLSDIPDSLTLAPPAIRTWVRRSARAVSGYYHGFPVPELRLQLRATAGDDISGRAYGSNHRITMRLGRDADADTLEDDWVLVHEMLHMGHPDVGDRHKWFKEGLTTYVEPIARARAGQLSAQRVWADFVRQLPQGQPRAGDRGLDRTSTWSRTYWGGALFFLLADVGIRRRTNNARAWNTRCGPSSGPAVPWTPTGRSAIPCISVIAPLACRY